MRAGPSRSRPGLAKQQQVLRLFVELLLLGRLEEGHVPSLPVASESSATRSGLAAAPDFLQHSPGIPSRRRKESGMRSLGLGLVLLGCAAMASGEEVGSVAWGDRLCTTSGGSAPHWRSGSWRARKVSAQPSERQWRPRQKRSSKHRRRPMMERGEWVDPATLTNEQISRETEEAAAPEGGTSERPEQLDDGAGESTAPTGGIEATHGSDTSGGWLGTTDRSLGRPRQDLLHHTVFAIRKRRHQRPV